MRLILFCMPFETHSPCDSFWCADFLILSLLIWVCLEFSMSWGLGLRTRCNRRSQLSNHIQRWYVVLLSFDFVRWLRQRWHVELSTRRKWQPWPTFIWKIAMCSGMSKIRCCEFAKLLAFGHWRFPWWLWPWPWFNARWWRRRRF